MPRLRRPPRVHRHELSLELARRPRAVDIVGDAWGHDVDLLVIPVERLAPEFFRLSTGLAGEVLQKLVSYGHQAAIVGDIEAHLAASSALRDFVRESNAGRHVWFLPDQAALDAGITGAT